MSFPAYKYAAEALSVHDGDTFTADVDLGFFVHHVTTIRLHGINAPELRATGGPEARAALVQLVTGEALTVQSLGPDKYGGRWQAIVTLDDGTDVGNALVAQGHAAVWDGTGVAPVP